jgi:nanos 1
VQDWSAFESKTFFDDVYSNFFKNDLKKSITPNVWSYSSTTNDYPTWRHSNSNNTKCVTNFNYKSPLSHSLVSPKDEYNYYDLSSIWSPSSSATQDSLVSSPFVSSSWPVSNANYIPPRVRRRNPTCIECVFCKNNGRPPEMYKTHILKDPEGDVTCPVLRSYNCPICNNGGGPQAHTVRYCPKNKPSNWQKGRHWGLKY